jgi:outer membrane receptor protein involved in Fe transport
MSCLQFQNVGEYVTEGLEFEGSYRNSAGWYAFGGGTYARVGSTDLPDGTESANGIVYGDVVNAPAWSGGGGVSTPKLGGLMHVSVEARYIGERVVRDDQSMGTATPLPDSPGWVGLNANIYIPNIHGFDITAGVRNIIGTRDMVVAPGDYDRVDQNGVKPTITIPSTPGEGREFFAKVGHAY